jgi:hypothetical protein
MFRRAALALLPSFALLVASTAEADQDARESVRLVYESSDGCPDREDFEALVRARTARALFVGPYSSARIFEVHLTGEPPPRGQLTVRRDGVDEGAREVRAETCSDVAEALALVAALAIDPNSLIGAPPPAGAPPGSPATSPPAAAAAPPVQAAPSPPPASRGSTQKQNKSEENSRSPSVPHKLYLGADLAMATGISPETLVGASPRVGWRAESTSLLAPSLSVGVLHATSGALPIPVGAASLAWTVGQIDGCALSWPPGPVRVVGCLRAEGGALTASGSDITPPQTHTRAWFAVGPLARGEWALLPTLFLTAEAAGMVHLTADRFFFRPDVTIRTVPVLGMEGSAGLGIHFL